jgi:hypothetical protein
MATFRFHELLLSTSIVVVFVMSFLFARPVF